VYIKKSIAFQIQINDNYKWSDCSQLHWVNDTRRKHVLFTKEINYNFILMLFGRYMVFHWAARTCSISRKSFVLRVANLFEAIIACQMNSIEFGVMLDLNLKDIYFFDTHCILCLIEMDIWLYTCMHVLMSYVSHLITFLIFASGETCLGIKWQTVAV
jgi:hypothetical protein